MSKFHGFVAAIGMLAISVAAAAQSRVSPGPMQRQDARFQLGLVLPLGNAGSRAEQAPRLEAWSERGAPSSQPETARYLSGNAKSTASPHIGITLGGKSRVMLNGREIPDQGDRKGMSTLGWVGIGAVAVIVVGGVLLVGAFKDMNN